MLVYSVLLYNYYLFECCLLSQQGMPAHKAVVGLGFLRDPLAN